MSEVTDIMFQMMLAGQDFRANRPAVGAVRSKARTNANANARTSARTARAAAIGVTALIVAAGAGGCTAGSAPAVGSAPAAGSAPTASYTAEVRVVQPGRPGEEATTLAPGQSGPRPQEVGWNADDLMFVSMMIDHHTQALRMAGLAPGRSTNPKVLAVAERVKAAQAPEIQMLKGWLRSRGQQAIVTGADEHAQHGGGMPGEISEIKLISLARAKGTPFDTFFLDLMIEHHAGAVQMASEVTTTGTDQAVQEIAAETAVGQNAEIRRMQALRRTL